MTALILLEYHFIKGKDGFIYCDRVIDYTYLERYLKVFDNIILCGRMTEAKEDCSDKLLVSGKNVQFIPIPDFQGLQGLLKNYSKIMRIIKGIIPKVQCCIMRAPNHLSLITYKLFKKRSLPFALEFNIAADKFIESESVIGKTLNKWVVKKTKNMCMTANGVSYVTNHILQENYPCRAMIDKDNKEYFTSSYSTIDLTDDMLYDQQWDKRKKPEKIKIIHTGYMDSYRKGHITLIHVVKTLIDKRYTNIELILVGDGKRKEEFEKLTNELNISDYVNFTGLIKKKEDMTKLLRQCHLLVFPTHSEGLPRSIIEAMAVGLVCISSPVDGIPELLEGELLVDFDNTLGYVNKIIELINDWPRMIEISKKNRILAENFKKEKMEKKRTSFYKKLRSIL